MRTRFIIAALWIDADSVSLARTILERVVLGFSIAAHCKRREQHYWPTGLAGIIPAKRRGPRVSSR